MKSRDQTSVLLSVSKNCIPFISNNCTVDWSRNAQTSETIVLTVQDQVTIRTSNVQFLDHCILDGKLPLLISTWFLKNKLDELLLSISSLIFTACVACKIQVRNKQNNTKKVCRTSFFKLNFTQIKYRLTGF